jgi:uncharacterized protein
MTFENNHPMQWENELNRLRYDYFSGSKSIALKALELLKHYYRSNENNINSVIEFADSLKTTKPTMAATENIIDSTVDILKKGCGEKSFGKIFYKLEEATIDTIEYALREMFSKKESLSVLTCSFSNTIINLIEKGNRKYPGVIVYALESDYNGIKYGARLKSILSDNGIICHVVQENETVEAVSECDCIIIGADRVVENIGVVNGTPSLLLAKLAYNTKPVYIIAESFKNSHEIVLEPGFEFIPAKYITKVFSDSIFPIIEINAGYIIDHLNMKAHPEGGFFTETYRSKEMVKQSELPERYIGDRNLSTCIYFLLKSGQVSKFHRLKTDEIWHFYSGCPMELNIIDENGNFSRIHLGSNINKGEISQFVVKMNCWIAAKPSAPNSYALVGCTMAPGFDYTDFEIADPDILINNYPLLKDIINEFS